MKIAAVAIVLLFALLSGCSYGPKGMSSDAYLATKKAAVAIRTLNDHALDSAFVYSPLLVDAERAIGEISAAAQKEQDRNAFFQSKKCVSAIADERKHATDGDPDPELIKLSAAVAAGELAELESFVRDRNP